MRKGTLILAVFMMVAAAPLGGCGNGDGGHDVIDDAADATDDAGTDAMADVTPWTPETIGLDAAGPADDVELPDGVKIRVGSYNLYGYHWSDAAHFGDAIRAMDVDLMALVESNEEQVDALATAAGFEYHCTNGDGRSLLSHTPLTSCEKITLVGDRTLIRAETTIDGVTFAVYVMHIDWDVIGNEQTRDFMDNYFAHETRKHVVMMGDFNDEHLSRQIMILEEGETGLADAFTAFGWYPGERITWPSQYFDDTEGSQTIDLIFFRKDLRPIVLDADAVNMSPCLSDHKPVWAELLYPRGDEPFDDALTMAKTDPYRIFAGDPDHMPQNLVENPGAEDGVTGWKVEGGAMASTERSGCTAAQGHAFFTGFAQGFTPDEGYSRLTQVIELDEYASEIDTRTAVLNVAAEMITCPFQLAGDDFMTNRVERYDDADVTVTFLDGAGRLIDRHVSKRRDTLRWYPWAAVIPIPPGTRSVELALTAYKRIDYVGGIDAGFDKVYLSVGTPGRVGAGLGDGNLLKFGMDEGAVADMTDAAIENNGWIARTSGTPLSLNGFPPVSVSGLKYLFAGDEIGLNPLELPVVASQDIELGPIQDAVEMKNNLALRWGGWTRTNTAEGAMVTMSLQLLDAAGAVWAEIPGETVWQSEWLYRENLTRIPSSIRSARFVLKAEVPVFTKFLGIEGLELQDDAAFADELFVRPELIVVNPGGVD